MERVTGKASKGNAMDPGSEGVKESGPRGAQPPKTRSPSAGVGNETKADMRGAQEGNPTDRNPLHGATKELERQHPIKYHDHGPHHGTDHHVRHEPLHGLKTEAHRHHAEKHSPSHREKFGR